jgi:hypothetical protein
MSARSGTSPTSPSRSWLWIVVWLAAAAALVGVVLVGAAPNSSWQSGTRGKVLDATVTILAVFLVFLTRKVLIGLSAARAGTVEVTANDSVPGDVLAAFRKALTGVYLSSPSAVPGESTPHDFLSDVREAATAKTGWGVAFLTVAALFRIRAYKVSCTAPHDMPDGRKVLIIEVFSKVGKDVQVTTVSQPTWEGVARQAACHVAAYVLPRTMLARQPPWVSWRRRQVNPELFYHFQEARRLAQTGRLEESLSHFDEATKLDPLNPYIRIERATVLDELGLYLDALGTYVDVVTAESWHDRPLWRRYRKFFGDEHGWDTVPRRLRRSPNGSAALQLARYRAVCSLAASHRLARQWHQHYTSRAGLQSGKDLGLPLRQPKRAREALRVIATLRPLLGRFYQKMIEEPSAAGGPTAQRSRGQAKTNSPTPDTTSGAPSAQPTTSQIEGCEPLLRRVLQYAALYEARHLERDYRWYKLRRRRPRLLISQSAIRFLPVWAVIQYRYVEKVQSHLDPAVKNEAFLAARGHPLLLRLPGTHRGPLGVLKELIRGKQPELVANEWPPDVVQARSGVNWALGRRAAMQGWLEHYNAACTFAVGMLTPELYPKDGHQQHLLFYPPRVFIRPSHEREPDSKHTTEQAKNSRQALLTEEEAERHRLLVQLAINQLSQAVTSSDSQFAAGISPWLRRGDQDLNDLRVTEPYATFVDRYLSAGSSWPPVPPNVAILIMSAHVLHLVQQVCQSRQALWDKRARSSFPVGWTELAEEAKWLKALREYCHDYRDWRTRYQFILLGLESGSQESVFDTAIPTLDDDNGWLDLNPSPAIAPTAGGKPALRHMRMLPRKLRIYLDPKLRHPILRQTQEWLQRSFELQNKADRLISSRNDVLDSLGDYLMASGCCLGEALAQAARSAELEATPSLPGSARLLANTWKVIADDTSLNSRGNQQINCETYIRQMRQYFGLNHDSVSPTDETAD